MGYLISGRCYRIGVGTSVYVELADTRQWHVVWADFIQRDERELLDPRGEAMLRVVAGVRQALREQPRLLGGPTA